MSITKRIRLILLAVLMTIGVGGAGIAATAGTASATTCQGTGIVKGVVLQTITYRSPWGEYCYIPKAFVTNGFYAYVGGGLVNYRFVG